MSKEKELVTRICAQVRLCCGCDSCAIKKRTPEENLKKFYSIYNYAGSRREDLLIEIKNLYPDLPDLKIKIIKEGK